MPISAVGISAAKVTSQDTVPGIARDIAGELLTTFDFPVAVQAAIKGTRCSRRAYVRGFTLIELMVVILIIGIMATFVTLSIGNRTLDARMDSESHRIEELVKLGLDEADLKGIPLGLSFNSDRYRFLSINDKHKWIDYAGSDILRQRPISPPFFIQLAIENQPISLGPTPQKEDDDKDATLVPQILLLPGGDATAFSLDLHAPNDPSYYHIEVNALGRVKRERLDEARR